MRLCFTEFFFLRLRYTIFLPAYPAQYVCEGVIMLRDIPYFEETKQFSIMLPNNYNFGFYFPYMLRVYLLFGFFPILYTTMNYMYQLRCKRLNIKQHRLNRPKKEDWNKSTFEIKIRLFSRKQLDWRNSNIFALKTPIG